MAMQYIQTGGDSDGYWIEVPDAPASPAPAQASGMKSLEELGFKGALADKFRAAGITQLPEWMGRYASGNWNYSDIVNDYKTIAGQQPSSNVGKAGDVLSNMGWTLDGGLRYTGTPLTTETRSGERVEMPSGFGGTYKPADPAAWGAGDQDFFEQMWMSRKQAPNEGAWEQSIKPALLGIGSIAAMAAGPLSGYGAVAEGGMAAAGGSLSSEATMAVSDMMAADALAAGGGSLSGISGMGEYGLSNMAPVEAATVGETGSLYGLADSAAQVGGYAGDMASSTPWYAGLNNSIGSWLGTGNNALTTLGMGSSIIGGLLGYNAQQNSIDAAKDTSKDSIAFQKYMYDEAVKNYAPFRQLGLDNLSALNNASATGNSSKYIGELESLGKNFTFDATDPAYTQKMKLATEANDKALASRGMYNSRAGLNLQDETARNIQASEYDKQFNRKYGTISDLFNMTNKNAATDYSKLLDMVKIGSGAASSAGSAATNLGSSVSSTYGQMANQELASGQSTASLFSGLGAQPLNYLLLQSLLNKN